MSNIDKIESSYPGHEFRLIGNRFDDEVELWVDGKYAFSLDEESFVLNDRIDYEIIDELLIENGCINN